jgi:NAD(P)-dependent dehydrogenase (short-subunit alcohol dehydrogenase family)
MASKRRTIVTVASQGIGAAFARAFLDRGYGVVGNARKLSGESFPPSPNLALVERGIGLETASGEDCADRNRKVWLDRPRCQHWLASSRANHSPVTPQFSDWAEVIALS